MISHNDIEDIDYDILHRKDDDDDDDDDKSEEYSQQDGVGYKIPKLEGDIDDYSDPIFTVDNCKALTIWFLERFTVNITFDDVMIALTIFVLFGTDFAQLAIDNNHDDVFNVLFTIALGFFCFEFIAVTFAKTNFSSLQYIPYAPAGPPPDDHDAWPDFLNFLPYFPTIRVEGYLFSFYWYLDLLSIISLCTDVPWIANPLGIDASITGSSNVTKAGRVVRLVRLVRLMRLYKIFVEKQKKIKQERRLMSMVQSGQIGYNEMESQRALQDLRQSRLSTQLSTSITHKVIVMILTMLIILPLLSYTGGGDRSVAFATKLLHKFNINEDINDASKMAVLNTTLEYTDSKWLPFGYTLMIQMEPFVDGFALYKPTEIADTRDEYKTEFKHTRYDSGSGIDYVTASIQSKRPFANLDAMYSILLTIFVGFMIIGGAYVFTSDAETNVLKPIERMTKMVEQVAANPLAPLVLSNSDDSGSGGYETKLLEAAISKITGLLSVGFGEAGAGIISANLSSSSATIDPLLPGVRVYALFGFCDIHQFEEVNNKLGNDVLVFVNTIAEIVHSSVHSWGGQCNKNLGNAFVLVWRVGDEEQLTLANDMSIMKRQRNNSNMDMSSPMVAMSRSSPSSRLSTGGAGSSSKSPFSPNSNQRDSTRISYLDQADDDDIFDEDDKYEEKKEKVKAQRPAMDLRRVPGVDVIAHGALIGFLKVIAEINRSATVLKYRREPRLTRLPPGDSDAKHFGGSSSNPMALPGTLHLHFKETRAAVRRTKAAAFQIIEMLQLPDPVPIPGYLVDSMLEDWEIAVIAREEKEDSIAKAAAANGNGALVAAIDDDDEGEPASPEPSANRRASTMAINRGRKEKESPRSDEGSKKKRRDSFASNNSENEEEAEMHEEFKVRMGFGLHAGWAIEGAVGSLFKVDATYLSPHVNMAARLETSSKQYGVPLLMSHLVYELLNPSVQQRCRKLDVVTVKGSEVPIGIYTYDCFQDQIFQTMNTFITAGTVASQSQSQKATRRDSLRSNDSGGSAKRRDSLQSQGSDSSSRPSSPLGSPDSGALSPPPPPPTRTPPIGTPGGGNKTTPSQVFRKVLGSINEDNSTPTATTNVGQSPTQFTSNPSLRASTSSSGLSPVTNGRPAPSPKSSTRLRGSQMLMRSYPEMASKIAFAHPAQLTNLNSADIFKFDVDLLQLRYEA